MYIYFIIYLIKIVDFDVVLTSVDSLTLSLQKCAHFSQIIN